MAQHSGFFDAYEINGVYDRVYSAADYCDNLATIIKNGVQYSSADDLKVTAYNKMTVAVAVGRAWINGHYYYNDTVFTELELATAPTGTNKRIDRVVLRLDTTESVRSIKLAILTGTAAATPAAPALTRSGNIYELCLADILVGAAVTEITNANITDQRENGSVCGWAASVTPAIMSMLKKYEWKTELAENTRTVVFDIPQYNAADVHILEVYTNGILETKGETYTINGRTITFANIKQANNEIKVILYKSIDGTGLDSVADEITELQNKVAPIAAAVEYIYKCNGVDDNVKLSEIAQDYLTGGSDYGSMKITVVGTPGVKAAAGGAGTSANSYQWFKLGTTDGGNRKLIFDFTNCGAINIPIAAGTYNTLFSGKNIHIIGASVIASNNAAGTMIRGFDSADGAIVAEFCRFWITGALTSYIAQTGVFKNCRGSVTTGASNAYCFYATAAALLRVTGGEFYAYCNSGYTSAVVYQTAATAVSIMYALNCPTVARSGFVQSYAFYGTNGSMSITDTITTLALSASIANIRGTLAQNKPGLM